jgi:hypothetical protein
MPRILDAALNRDHPGGVHDWHAAGFAPAKFQASSISDGNLSISGICTYPHTNAGPVEIVKLAQRRV